MPTETGPVLSALLSAIRSAAAYNKANEIAPAAILWTDGERQWEALLPRLREEGPDLPLLTLGAYDPLSLTGPAIWLRCMVARTLPEANWSDGVVPILYLPGVSRQQLRAVQECPESLKPLVEIQYRSAFWSQKNGKDWTIAAFLGSPDGGLGIQIATDPATREAVRLTLLKLANQPVDRLKNAGTLTARWIIDIGVDPVRSVLEWLDNPEAYRSRGASDDWATFRARCQDRFQFDPEADGPITAAGHLGERGDEWGTAWSRFSEAPHNYPSIPSLLRQARPKKAGGLFWQPSSWPQDNEAEEASLREKLSSLANVSPAEARKSVRDLEAQHGVRRGWVWASLGKSPLASALPSLVELAGATDFPLGGSTPQEIAANYAAEGWKADAAMVRALAGVKDGVDVDAIKIAVNTLYFTWVRDGAEAFQKAVRVFPLPLSTSAETPTAGRCLLFSDGLRYDVGERLAGELKTRGMDADVEWQFSALPGVTPTAKPAVSPIATLLGPGPGFTPTVKSDGAKVAVEVLRRELEKAGYAVLQGEDTGSPTGAAWTESVSMDTYGHGEGWKLVRRVQEAIGELAERIQRLLDSGWQEVRVVTDHGWLLLPGGLPKSELPEHLTEVRKGRCARLKEGANTDAQTVPWQWDAGVRIALAPGISCYVANREYEHGGLSVQECVVPALTVTRSLKVEHPVSIREIKWRGLRCHVTLAGAQPGLKADLRKNAADPSTTFALEMKAVSEQGTVSLVAADEDRVGDAVIVVVLSGGQVVAQRLTVIGGE